jgi:SAM-dependent methyltransferase
MKQTYSSDYIRRQFQDRVMPLYDGYRDAEQFGERTDRVVFYATLVERLKDATRQPHVLDLGGGLSPFAPLLASLGYAVTMIDDFGGGGGIEPDTRSGDLAVIERFRGTGGVRIIEGDFLHSALPLDDASVDVVTSFHSIEHWHSSPMSMFSEIRRVLRPGGHVVIGCPNAVNLRKRLWVLFGRTNHCSLREWYYDGSPFRGHVREPTVNDLRELLAWNGFEVVDVFGRNFIGQHSHSLPAGLRSLWLPLLSSVDPLLRLRPTLCSDIHVIGRVRPDARLATTS